MTENDQVPPAGGEPVPAQPSAPPNGQAASESAAASAVQPVPQPGRRRRRRRGRRGRGGLAQGAPASPNGQGAAPSGGNGAALPGGAAAGQAPLQAIPEALEEVEGVLQFEGKGQGWLRDAKRSYLPQPLDVEVPRWLVDRMHLQ